MFKTPSALPAGWLRSAQLWVIACSNRPSPSLHTFYCCCYSKLELPLTRAFDAGKTAACVQLIPDPAAPGRLKPGAIEPVLSVRDVEVPVSSGGIGRRYAASAWAKKALASCRWVVGHPNWFDVWGYGALSLTQGGTTT